MQQCRLRSRAPIVNPGDQAVIFCCRFEYALRHASEYKSASLRLNSANYFLALKYLQSDRTSLFLLIILMMPAVYSTGTSAAWRISTGGTHRASNTPASEIASIAQKVRFSDC
jgi:hypothetical protein